MGERFLEGKTALVTGSTSGIGYAIACTLASAGAHIVLNGFGDEDEIEKERARIANDHGVEVMYSGADMSKPKEIQDLCATAIKKFGSVDILVNNAGIQSVHPIQDFPDEKWDAIMAINLSSAFHTIKHCIGSMRDKGWGRIINIASAHGIVASPYKSAYVAAKHGIVGMTKVVALEAARDNITANAVCPGYVQTPLVDGQVADQAKAHGMSEDEVIEKVILDPQPTKKFVQPEEVAELTLYLCRESAQGITGRPISIDGGWTAR